jgi:asparagine synthase (glutamine-hydrolysing)
MIRADFARKLIDQHLPEHPSYYGTMVWILMMLEHWLQAHAADYRLR